MASKAYSVADHLKLSQQEDDTVPVKHFCSQLYASITKELSRREITDRLTLIRILGLLSLHHEGTDGAEQASSCLAQAVHHAQTLGLQLHRPVRDESSSTLKRTFWCIWSLDRLNAAIHGRPCCMADIDISTEYLTPDEYGSAAFHVWFKIATLLNHVIALYRPRSQGVRPELDAGYPAFEEILDETRAWQLSRSMIGTLRHPEKR